MATGLRDGELESAVEMGAAVHAGDVTSVELAERAIGRAEAWQPFTNAFSQLWPDEALEAARALDASPRRNASPLCGVPIAVKDLYDVAGHETSGCCEAYRGTVADADATIITRLRRAGIVMVGKTNQHELAAGGTNTVSACGAARNPWDASRMTGGSSGGSAAVVAAGVVPIALGSDTGGSIRIPASLCGTFGLKPTSGRFPLDGVMPLAPSMDCPGPMAATAGDLVLALDAMGASPAAAASPPLRIGVPDGFFADRVHDDVLAVVRDTADVLASLGARIDAIDGRGLGDVRGVWMGVCTPEFFDAHPALRGARRELVAPSVRGWLEQGERATAEDRAAAAVRRDEVRAWFDARLEELDMLLIPTTPFAAPAIDAERVDLGSDGSVSIERIGPGYLTCSVNLAGLPAVSLPAGRSGGMPVGVSLVGRRGADASVLDLASTWERNIGHVPSRSSLTTP